MTNQLFPDKKFLEFWGNLLINAAKGQEQFEQLASLMQYPTMGTETRASEGIDGLFKQFYDLNSASSPKKENSPSSGRDDGIDTPHSIHDLNDAYDHFFQSFSAYAELWGWVPKKEHDALKQKHETLKKNHQSLQNAHDTLTTQCETQKQLIVRLKQLLNEDGKGEMAFFQELQNLAQKQSDDFQTFMNRLGNVFTHDGDTPDSDHDTK